MADYIIVNGELRHHGVKGQRWGFRRYQNSDGSLTLAGRIRQARLNKKRKKALEKARQTKAANKIAAEERAKKLAAGKIKPKDMTDAELKAQKERLQLEKDYVNALKESKQRDRGSRFIDKVLDSTQDKIADQVVADIVTQSVKALGVKAVNDYFKKSGSFADDVIFTNNRRK